MSDASPPLLKGSPLVGLKIGICALSHLGSGSGIRPVGSGIEPPVLDPGRDRMPEMLAANAIRGVLGRG